MSRGSSILLNGRPMCSGLLPFYSQNVSKSVQFRLIPSMYQPNTNFSHPLAWDFKNILALSDTINKGQEHENEVFVGRPRKVDSFNNGYKTPFLPSDSQSQAIFLHRVKYKVIICRKYIGLFFKLVKNMQFNLKIVHICHGLISVVVPMYHFFLQPLCLLN